MSATTYWGRFSRLLTDINATDKAGTPMSLDEAIERVISMMADRGRYGRKILFIGNGGSAAIASHMAVDYWKNGGLRALSFNDPSLLTCISNDCGYPAVFEQPVRMFAEPDDLLIAISCSGQSINILNAVKAARERGCLVITLSGFLPDNALRNLGIVNLYVPACSYGFVEVAHLAILHCALDLIMARAALPKNGGS